MSGDQNLSFQEESYNSYSSEPQQVSGGLQGKLFNLVIKSSGGIIKTEKGASYIVIGIVIILFIISFSIFKNSLNTSSAPAETDTSASYNEE